AQKLATGMRRVAWEKLGRLARRKKNEQAFMAGGYDQEIIERWNVLNAPFSGKKSLIDAAEPGYGEFTEKITRYKIKAFNGRGELVPAEPVPNFDALCRIVSLQKFEAASVGSGKTLIVGQTTFNRQEIKILEEIGESRRQGKTATVYKGMSAGQEFLIKNAAQCIYHDAGNSNKPTASKKEFIDLYLKGGSKLSASDRSKLSLESSQSVWDWAKETWDLEKEGLPPPQAEPEAKAEPAAEEEEPFHLISEEELRQKGDDHGELQSVSESLPQEPEAEPKESGEIKIAMKTSWASEAVTVAKDANGGVRIDPKNPELPSKWKKDGRQYERRGEVAVIKAGDKEVELSMVDQGTEVTGFPREVENQMSYFFELDFGYQVEAEEVKRWFKDLPVLDYLRGSDPLKWGEAKIERREPGDSLTLTIGQTKYHICVPQHSSNVKVSWFDTRRDDYNENKFPAKELFNDLSAMAEIYTNIWLGKEAGQAVAAEQKPEAPAEAEEKAETSESLQDLARELIDKRERYFEEDDEEKEQKLQERINELENKFEEIFTDGEKGLFRRAFYHSDSVLPDDFISVEKGRDDFISLEYEFAELGVESCAEGRLGDKAIQSLPQLFEKVNGILKRNEKEALMKFDDFLSAFNELVSGAVVPAELEKTEEPEEKPASTEAEKSKKIALTDFRL
ncbi:hypothetical protein L6272_01805, partial [Microgenomates group bacterium]|nr:hypothetical protein [Microgenomates group bacterium]